MIRIEFRKNKGGIQSMDISGHAEAGAYGEDLVCCGVSAIAISAMNAIDEMFQGACTLKVTDNRIRLNVVHNSDDLQIALKMVQKQLRSMQETAPKKISLNIR